MAAVCPLCQDDINEPAGMLIELPCRHIYHRICLAKQTIHRYDDIILCSQCRAPYTTTSLRQVLKNEIKVVGRAERAIKRAAKAKSEENARAEAQQTALEFQRIENGLDENDIEESAAEVNGEGEIVEDIRPGSGQGEIVTNARVPHWLFPYIPDWYHLPRWRGGNIKMRNSKRKPSTRRRKRSQSKLNYSKRRNIVLNNKR